MKDDLYFWGDGMEVRGGCEDDEPGKVHVLYARYIRHRRHRAEKQRELEIRNPPTTVHSPGVPHRLNFTRRISSSVLFLRRVSPMDHSPSDFLSLIVSHWVREMSHSHLARAILRRFNSNGTGFYPKKFDGKWSRFMNT